MEQQEAAAPAVALAEARRPHVAVPFVPRGFCGSYDGPSLGAGVRGAPFRGPVCLLDDDVEVWQRVPPVHLKQLALHVLQPALRVGSGGEKKAEGSRRCDH